jgi:hypothetical protein
VADVVIVSGGSCPVTVVALARASATRGAVGDV